MTTTATDSTDKETLRYLWAPDLNPLFWRPARTGVISRWYGHVPFAHWIVCAAKPRTLVELGTHNGVSYSAFCEAVMVNRLDTRCYAVDTWKGDDQAGYYGEEVYRDFRRFHDERFAGFSELLRCTFDDALTYMPDASVDLLHIDGLHTYEAVRHDFENWRSKLSDRAVVLFHDTNVRERNFGVWRLWEELRMQFPSFEFLHGHGLGVLAVGHFIAPHVTALCSLDDATRVNATRDRFSFLGDLLAQRELLQNEEIAAGEERIQLLETAAAQRAQFLENEVAARDARILSMEAGAKALDARIVSLESGAARRVAAEEQLRARAAQRSREARLEVAKAAAQVELLGIKPPSSVVAVDAAAVAAAATIGETNKPQVLDDLRERLAGFLFEGHRLSFPKVAAPDISVIIVLFNQAHFTLHCLRAVLSQRGVSLQVILVDNNSTDETAALLRRLDNVQVLKNQQNIGFVVAVNQAAVEAQGRTILLLNSDAFVREDALAIALKTLDSDPDIGAVGGRLVLPSGRLQEAGSIVWSDGTALGYGRGLPAETGEAMFRRDVDYCSAAFLLTPRATFERLGGLDPIYAPAYYEDADYCLRLAKTGLRVVYEPRAVIDHYEFGSQTRKSEAVEQCMRNRKRFRLCHVDTLRQQHFPHSETNVLFARDRARARRRVLVIETEVPYRFLGAGYPRMAALLNEAFAAGSFVTLYPLQSPVVDWKRAHGEFAAEIEICDGRGVAGLAGFLRERQGYYDVILVSRPDNMALFKEALRDQPSLIDGTQVVYDAEALFAARSVALAKLHGQPMSAEEVDGLINQETELTAGVDSVVTVTPSEAQVFRARQPAPVYVLGYPARLEQETPDFTARGGFLFVGRLLAKEAPNYEGLSWFVHSVWPHVRATLGEVQLTVVGLLHPEPTELAAPGVLLEGPVDDLRPFYARARVFIAPVRFAAGVPIKILEAGAAGLPVVATKLMAMQLGWQPGREIEATDDAKEMTEAAIALYKDFGRWSAIRAAALHRLSAEHSEAAFQRELRVLLTGADTSSCALGDRGEKGTAHDPAQKALAARSSPESKHGETN